MDNETVALREELAVLAERIAALERRTGEIDDAGGDEAAGAAGAAGTDNTAGTAGAADAGAVPSPFDAETFWALNALNARLGDHPSTVAGEVMLVGSLTLPDGGPVAWQQSGGTAGMFASDWSDSAAVFAALGHPVRLELLRQILSGTHTTAELAAAESLGTTGQLHHHLRQLVTAGWVRQIGRGSYEVPAARVVPLLACVLGSQR